MLQPGSPWHIKSKELDDILDAIMKYWVSLFGPLLKLVSDQEGALTSPDAGMFLESRGVLLHLLAKEQHAAIVERHHASLLRQLHHLLEDQTMADGTRISFDGVLAESVFAKNALFALGGAAPYEAVFGRAPHLFGTVDQEAGSGFDDRDSDRIRHLALQAVIQSSAENKLKRASSGKSRTAGELMSLQVGDQFEFFRRSTTKDPVSWNRPATVVDLNVRCQVARQTLALPDPRRAPGGDFHLFHDLRLLNRLWSTCAEQPKTRLQHQSS